MTRILKSALILLFAAIPAPAQVTIVWQDNLESGAFVGWTASDFRTTVSNELAHTGTYASRTYYTRCGYSAPYFPSVTNVAGTGAPAESGIYRRVSYVNAAGETLAGSSDSGSHAANYVFRFASPAAYSNGVLPATGYNVYLGTTAAGVTLQNAAGVGCAAANADGSCQIGTTWTEPITGMVAGAAKPTINKAIAPAAPSLSQTAGGALGARTYYVVVTGKTLAPGETWYSAESTLAIDANKLLKVTSPAASTGDVTQYNVYASTVSGTETKQTTSSVNLGTDWTEPGTGLIAGSALPTSVTGCGSTSDSRDKYAQRVQSPGLEQFVFRGYVYIKSPTTFGAAVESIQRKLLYLKDPAGDTGDGHPCSDHCWAPVITSFDALNGGIHRMGLQFIISYSLGGDKYWGTGSSFPIVWMDYDASYYIEILVVANTSGAIDPTNYLTGGLNNDGFVKIWLAKTGDPAVLVLNTLTDPSSTGHTGGWDIRKGYPTGITKFNIGEQVNRVQWAPIDEVRYWDDVVLASGTCASPPCIGPLGAGPEASPTPVSVNFNDTNVGNTSADSPEMVTLTNNGGATLNISDISITGAHAANFSKSTTCGATLVASASCTVSVSFTPSALGVRTASLVFTNDATDSPQSVSLSGTGTGAPPAPAVSLSVSAINFDARTVGTTSDAEQITLYNSGDGTLNIASIAASTTSAPTSPGDFAIDSTTCGATLAPAASCTVNVSFTPVAGGSRTGRIRFTTDAASSPDDVSTSGTGQIVLTLRGGTFRGLTK